MSSVRIAQPSGAGQPMQQLVNGNKTPDYANMIKSVLQKNHHVLVSDYMAGVIDIADEDFSDSDSETDDESSDSDSDDEDDSDSDADSDDDDESDSDSDDDDDDEESDDEDEVEAMAEESPVGGYDEVNLDTRKPSLRITASKEAPVEEVTIVTETEITALHQQVEDGKETVQQEVPEVDVDAEVRREAEVSRTEVTTKHAAVTEEKVTKPAAADVFKPAPAADDIASAAKPAAIPSKPPAAMPTKSTRTTVATPTKPAATPTKPPSSAAKPAATPTKPAATPTKPAATPTKPAATPTKPAATPTKPAPTPTKPAPIIKAPVRKELPPGFSYECSPIVNVWRMLGGADDFFIATLDVEDYFVVHTPEQIAGYDTQIVTALRRNDVSEIRRLHVEEGRPLQVSNKFGETICHMACRRGVIELVKYMVEEGGVSLRVRDDYGRTPMHDSCWTATPQIELMYYIINHAPEMLFMTDVYGFSPLGYARFEHWAEWNKFIFDNYDLILTKGKEGRLLSVV